MISVAKAIVGLAATSAGTFAGFNYVSTGCVLGTTACDTTEVVAAPMTTVSLQATSDAKAPAKADSCCPLTEDTEVEVITTASMAEMPAVATDCAVVDDCDNDADQCGTDACCLSADGE